MQLHQLRPQHKRKSRKRIGRGGKRGTYSGRGMKGQKSRAGRRLKPVIRELLKRYPKLRGYKFKLKTKKRKPTVAIGLDVLERKFSEGEKVTPAILGEKRIVRRIKGKVPIVKIVAKGEIKKRLLVEGCAVSRGAREKIEGAGGRINEK